MGFSGRESSFGLLHGYMEKDKERPSLLYFYKERLHYFTTK